MSKGLKKCPFCGSEEIYAKTGYGSMRLHGEYLKYVYIYCIICGAKTKLFTYYGDPDDVDWEDVGTVRACAAWNLRAQ